MEKNYQKIKDLKDNAVCASESNKNGKKTQEVLLIVVAIAQILSLLLLIGSTFVPRVTYCQTAYQFEFDSVKFEQDYPAQDQPETLQYIPIAYRKDMISPGEYQYNILAVYGLLDFGSIAYRKTGVGWLTWTGGEYAQYLNEPTVTDVTAIPMVKYGTPFNSYGSWATWLNPWDYIDIRGTADANAYQQGYNAGYYAGSENGFERAYSEQYDTFAGSLNRGGNIGEGAIGGFFNGLSGFFSTIVNGVSIGGVTVLSILSSAVIILLLYYILKVVKG